MAASEGHTFVLRTVEEWIDGSNRFDRPGEHLFVARVDTTVVGMCGLNIDPYVDDPDVGRLRHLYVAPEWRRHGVATGLVRDCLASAKSFGRVRVRTFDKGAAAFYLALGFREVDEPDATHATKLSE